jgi:DNA-directed RNA polymerase specialized sigma24 family protein
MASVSRALRQIAADRAEAIELCIFGNLTAVEAGQVMEKSEAAVKMLVMRGLKDLRRRLAQVAEEL